MSGRRDTVTKIKGRCVACGFLDSLFVTDAGFVTCARAACPDPGAVDDVLHSVQPGASHRRVNAFKLVAQLDYSKIESLHVDAQYQSRRVEAADARGRRLGGMLGAAGDPRDRGGAS